MIILDGEAGGQAKQDTYEGLTLRHLQEVHTRTNSLLPDYATSEAHHWKVAQPEQPKPSRFDSRTWKGALYALAVYIFLSLVILTPILLTKSKRQYDAQVPWSLGSTDSLWAVENQDFSVPLQLSPAGAMALNASKTCNVWNSTTFWNNTSKVQFSLPPTGLITIRSNVTSKTFKPDQITGSLSVSMNKDLKATTIQFTVEVQFSSEDVRCKTHVCFSQTGSDRGLSIFVPTRLSGADNLNFRLEVLLPHVTAVDSFVTSLPMLTQSFDDLHPYFTVNEFFIEGTDRPIICKFLQATQISVQNVAGSIHGNFNVTSAINIDSIKGSIISNITLTRQPFRLQPIFLTMDTGDSAINANIFLDSLTSSSSPQTSTAYIAKVATFNGPLDLNISSRKNSPNLPLHLQVQNNLAESTISMDATYQGSFSAKTKLSQVTVTDAGVSPGDAPPGVKGSRKIVYDQNSGDIASGWIGWGSRPTSDQDKKQSYVDIVSALGPVTLTFG